MPRRLRLIVNPNAGGGRTLAELPVVEEALRGHAVEFTVQQTTGIEHAQALARGAVQAGDVAVSYGGDGLAGAVAHALRGSQGTLGLLPGGRGNDFARKLGIPLDAREACAVLARGEERTVDVAEVDGRTFLGIASFGIDTEVQDIANATTRLNGQAVYLYATLRALAAWKAVPLELAVDGGEPRRFDGYSVAACNSGVYGGGMHLAPDADIADGLIESSPTATSRSGGSCAAWRASSAVRTCAIRPSSSCRRARCTSMPGGRSASTPTGTRSA